MLDNFLKLYMSNFSVISFLSHHIGAVSGSKVVEVSEKAIFRSAGPS